MPRQTDYKAAAAKRKAVKEAGDADSDGEGDDDDDPRWSLLLPYHRTTALARGPGSFRGRAVTTMDVDAPAAPLAQLLPPPLASPRPASDLNVNQAGTIALLNNSFTTSSSRQASTSTARPYSCNTTCRSAGSRFRRAKALPRCSRRRRRGSSSFKLSLLAPKLSLSRRPLALTTHAKRLFRSLRSTSHLQLALLVAQGNFTPLCRSLGDRQTQKSLQQRQVLSRGPCRRRLLPASSSGEFLRLVRP